MKSWIIAAVALLAGLVIGGWAPRADLRSAKEELESTKKMLKSKGGRTTDLGGITQLIGIENRAARERGNAASRNERSGEGASTPSTADSPAGSNAVPSAIDVVAPTTGSVDSAGNTKRERDSDGRPDKRSLKESIDNAIELWKTRSDVARTTFVNNLGLSPEEAVKFDVTIQAMNIRIGHGIQKMADNLKTNDVIGEETFVRLGSELTGAIVQGYNDLDRAMPRGWRTEAGEFSLMDFVDPNVAKPLIPYEEKLNSATFGREKTKDPVDRRRRGGHEHSVEVRIQ